MEQSEYRARAYDMIYLVVRAVKEETPDRARIDGMDMNALFEICQSHILTACTAYALESAGVYDENFKQAKNKAIRKNILLDTERKKILSRLEQERIWYMPLKGALLKDWYPKLGMRQMSDNDILCDGNYRRKIKDIMRDMGFTCKHYGEGNDDAYYKPPVCNFEMHNELFRATHVGKLYAYFGDVKERLVKDEGNDYGYHFRTEDFYIYITAHEYKHYAGGGTGVRSLVDIYIFMQKFGDALDWDYLNAEFEKLEITDFEQQSRTLAMKLFNGDTLNDQEKEMFDYYIFSGTYGTMDNAFHNMIEEKGGGSKKRYILQRFFPPIEHYKVWYPWAYKHKVLIPAAWVFRIVRGVTVRRKKISAEYKYLSKNSEDGKDRTDRGKR